MKNKFTEEEIDFLIAALEINEDEYNRVTNQDIRNQIRNYDMYTKQQDEYFEKIINTITKEYGYQAGDEVPISLINSLVKDEEIKPLVRDFQEGCFKNRKQVIIELINQLKFMEKININNEKGRKL